MDGEALTNYTDKKIIDGLKQHVGGMTNDTIGSEDSAAVLIAFLDAIIHYVEITSRPSRSSSSSSSSSATFDAQPDDEKYKTRNDLLALIVAAIMSAGDAKFSWPKAMGISIIFRSLTNSKMVLDIVHAILPGSPSYTKLYSLIRQAVAASGTTYNDINIFRRDVVAMYDNLGEYRVKTSRAGQKAALLRVIPIITMICLFVY